MNITNIFCETPPRNRKSTQLAVGSIFIVLTTLAIGLRLVGRPLLSASFGVDDGIGTVTYVRFKSGACVRARVYLTRYRANIGWGTDMWALETAQIITQMKCSCQLFYAGIVAFYVSVSLAKISILFFYLRIFTTPTFKRIAYTIISLCSIYAVASVVTSILDCTPPSYFWTRFDGVSTGSCSSRIGFKVMPPINIVLDAVVMVLPLPLLARLNLPLQKKIRVLSMFSVGALIIVADILRITHLYHSITTYNITYNGGELSYFGVIEAGVSVICTCMPAIASLLKRILPQWHSTLAKRSYPYRTIDSNRHSQPGTSQSHSQRGRILSKSYSYAWEGGNRERHGNGNEDADDIHLMPLYDTLAGYEEIQRPQKCLTAI
ncbi:hypothetical protein BDV10DRAFT_201902 [Aspergillus recurvatus]